MQSYYTFTHIVSVINHIISFSVKINVKFKGRNIKFLSSSDKTVSMWCINVFLKHYQSNFFYKALVNKAVKYQEMDLKLYFKSFKREFQR